MWIQVSLLTLALSCIAGAATAQSASTNAVAYGDCNEGCTNTVNPLTGEIDGTACILVGVGRGGMGCIATVARCSYLNCPPIAANDVNGEILWLGRACDVAGRLTREIEGRDPPV